LAAAAAEEATTAGTRAPRASTPGNAGSGAAASGTAEPVESGTRLVTCAPHGRRWRLEWGARSVVVEPRVGILHLAVLLANPGQEIEAVDLIAGLTVLNGAAGDGTRQARSRLDRTTLRELRLRLVRLREDADEPPPRKQPELANHARIAVGKSIRRAVNHIAEADAEIGEHLRRTVVTGARCSYRPA